MGKYYDIEAYDSDKKSRYMDSIRALNMEQVLSALLFFSSLEAELLNSSLEYLAREITEIMTEATKPAHQTA
jgi:diacylglycerol kinase